MLNFDELFQPRQSWRRRSHPLTSYARHHFATEKRALTQGLFPIYKNTSFDDSLTMRVSRDIFSQDFADPFKENILGRTPLSFLSSLF